MRISVALALGALVAFPVAAAAQNTVQQPAVECLCVLPAEVGPGVAAIQDVQGQVLLSGAVGYTPIESEAELSVGDRLVLLDDGRAVLTGPACRVTLAPDSTIRLIPVETGICVAQAATRPGVAGLTGTQIPGLIVAGGLVVTGVAGAVIKTLSEDGAPPTPVSP